MEQNGDLIAAYLDALDSHDFDAAVALFATDALYLRPEAASTGPGLAVMRGQEAIRAALDRRGYTSGHHVVDRLITDGNASFAQGHIEGMDRTVIFLVSAVANEAGMITEFAIIGQPIVSGDELLALDAG